MCEPESPPCSETPWREKYCCDDYTNDNPCLETPLREKTIISLDNSDCPDLTASIVERTGGVEEGGEEVKEEGVPPPTKPKSDPICKNIYLLLT